MGQTLVCDRVPFFFITMEITLDYLKECLDYDSETGIFRWKSRPPDHFRTNRGWKIFMGRDSGKVVGSPTALGYLQIVISFREIFGKHFLAHRVAWAFVHGEWPSEHIDHKNGVVSDNRISNLRAATNSENMMNARTPSHNTSGVKGVCFNKLIQKWQAEIIHNKVRHPLGYFVVKEEAVAAVRALREKLHWEFANHGDGHDPYFE